MKNIIFICFSAVFLISYSCKTKKGSQMDNSGDKSQISPPPPSTETYTYRLVVSFFSRGEGADYKIKDALDAFIFEYQKKVAKELNIEKYLWGREGEIDYCFMLKELSPGQQQTFIRDARTILEKSKLVFVTENTGCLHKR